LFVFPYISSNDSNRNSQKKARIVGIWLGAPLWGLLREGFSGIHGYTPQHLGHSVACCGRIGSDTQRVPSQHLPFLATLAALPANTLSIQPTAVPPRVMVPAKRRFARDLLEKVDYELKWYEH
jgi:hypothetical protein